METARASRGLSPHAKHLPILVFGAFLALVTLSPGLRPVSAQEATVLAIDANPAGNTATNVPSVETCFAPRVGETFTVDVIVQDVEDLLGWIIYIEFDAEVLEVVGRDVDLFQGANEGSAVYDVSDPIPAQNSPYQIAAVDTSDPPTPDTGSGVLGRITFRANAAGVSPVGFARLDFEGDGTLDRAPFLRNADTEAIGDEDGDGYFDGEAIGAEIAIGGECEDTGSAPIDESNGEGSSVSGLLIAAGAGAGVLLVFGIAGAAIWRRRNGKGVADT